MAEPEIAQKGPFAVEVEEDRIYFWCRCGRSRNQPFCDGSHTGTGFTPVRYKAGKSATVYFCGCKHSGKAPMCDGTHSSL